MAATVDHQLPRGESRRQVRQGLLKASAVTCGVVLLYYTLPLDHLTGVPLWLSVTVSLVILMAVTAYQLRAVLRAPHPATKAVEGLAITAPLFLIVFATTYFLLSQDDGANFSQTGLSRTDALYFTVTVFSTVGFGDITATSQTARVAVVAQMILDLIVVGAVVRVYMGAVRMAQQDSSRPRLS